jgi:hypothetical protein
MTNDEPSLSALQRGYTHDDDEDEPVDTPTKIVTVLVHRHPDYADEIIVSAPPDVEIRTIQIDDGADYNGYPHTTEEREIVREMVVNLLKRITHLPATDPDPVRTYALGWIAGMQEYLDDDSVPVDPPDRDADGADFSVMAATDRYPDIEFTASDFED